MTLYVQMPHATFLLVTEDGICQLAPPIAKWCVGRREPYLETYWRRRGALVEHIQDLGSDGSQEGGFPRP